MAQHLFLIFNSKPTYNYDEPDDEDMDNGDAEEGADGNYVDMMEGEDQPAAQGGSL